MNHPTRWLAYLAALIGLVSCGDHEAPEQEQLPAITVQVAPVASEQVPILEEAVGTVRPRLSSKVAANTSGRIMRLLATPGKRVESGDALVEIEVDELRASLDRARASLEQTNGDLDRYRNLLATGATTQAEFDRIQAQQRVAAATVKETESLVAHATVTAPFTGVITQKFAEAGDLAVPGQPLFAIEDATLLRLEIDVAESLAGTISLDQKLQVAGAGVTLEGVVSEIAPAAEAASRTFLIKLDLPGHEALRAGQFGRAFIPRGARDTLLAPAESVFSRGQMDYVFVATPTGTANLRIVRIGTRIADRIEILAGIESGESVILAPPAELRDGQAIKIGAG